MSTSTPPTAKKSISKKTDSTSKFKNTKRPAGKKVNVPTGNKIDPKKDRWILWESKFADSSQSNDCKVISERVNGCQVIAYKGDAMTLLAFDLDQDKLDRFVGFSIECVLGNKQSYYLFNSFQFDQKYREDDQNNPITQPLSSLYAPFQKFRWLHVPGDFHQQLNKTYYGPYNYNVTPRYMGNNGIETLDNSKTVSVKINVEPFASAKKKLEVGFTRGFVSSQAYVHRFGTDTTFRPDDYNQLIYDTNAQSGSINGTSFTYADQYNWCGFTAREKLFSLLEEIVNDQTKTCDIFAYDLDEPDVCATYLKLAKQGRIRMILDNATLHTQPDVKHKQKKTFEDQFEDQFNNIKKGKASIIRGKFQRFSHDKVIIVKENGNPEKVLTGSTNFSLNGLYINANHVLLFNDPSVAELYEEVFTESFSTDLMRKFKSIPLAQQPQKASAIDYASFNFSPHKPQVATDLLTHLSNNVLRADRSILFSVMDITGGGPLLKSLFNAWTNQNILSYGVTDKGDPEKANQQQTTQSIQYVPGSRQGILVNTQHSSTNLPKPFAKEPSYHAHKIHHKFVVIDFNSDQAKLFCGSSNLALGGEEQNGDNLIEINDRDIATMFAIEAIRLTDHYAFRTAVATNGASRPLQLDNTNGWTKRYYNSNDIKYIDRLYFSR